MKKSLLLTLVLSFIFSHTKSQTLDSLKQIYSNQKGTNKLQTIKNIIAWHTHDVDSLSKYAEIGIKESNQIGHSNYKGIFLFYLSMAQRNNYEIKKAIVNGKQALNLLIENENLVWASGMCNDLAYCYQYKLMYDSAIFFSLKGLKMHNKLDLNPGRYQTIKNIAYSYELSEDIEKALEWYKKLTSLSIANNDEYYESIGHFNIGNVFDVTRQFDSSLYHKKLSYNYFKNSTDQNHLSLLGNIGNTFIKMNELDSALHYTRKFHSLARTQPYNSYNQSANEQARSSINLGAIYFKLNNSLMALKYLKEGTEKAEIIDYYEKSMEGYEWLYHVYKSLDKTRNALFYYEKFIGLRNTAQSDKNKQNIQLLSVKYETEKKEKEILLLTSQTDIQNLQIQNNQYAMIGGGIIAILFIISTIALYSRKNYKLKTRFAQEKEAQQKSRFKAVIDAEEKERKRIAQELHDGLGQLLSTARLNVSVLESEENDSQNTQVNNSLKLIDDAVSEVRNISHNMMPNALISIGFEAALKEQVHLINDADKVIVHLELPNEPLNLEESKAISLYRVIQEILNNALKYAEANNIWISISSDDSLQISIKDDGKGFDTKLIENSTGIGWGNVISRTDLLNGEIDIQSEIGKGSEVSLKLAM